jgi:hypothetical protein
MHQHDAQQQQQQQQQRTVVFRVADELNLHALHQVGQLLTDVPCALHAAQLHVVLKAPLAAEV